MRMRRAAGDSAKCLHTAACDCCWRAESGVDSGRAEEQVADKCGAPGSGSQINILSTLRVKIPLGLDDQLVYAFEVPCQDNPSQTIVLQKN